MHIIISGYYGFDNVGDEAILFSIIKAMRSKQTDIKITVLSNHPELTAKKYEVHAVNRWKPSEVYQAIRGSDGLISGGGSLLQDETGIRSIPYYAGIIQLAHWLKKPTFIYAQGMGPINRPINKWLTKKVLNKVGKITVRDMNSQQLLEQIGIKQDSLLVPDPVLGLDGSLFSNEWTKQQNFTGDFISVSVRDWPTDQPYKEKIATSLDDLVRNGYNVVFVPMHGSHDEITSKETAALMKEKSYISPGDLTIQEKISIIGESSLLVGIRLHSLIFAAVNYIPFVALSYDPKIDAFADICNQPVVGHISNDDWTSDDLLKQVNQTLTNLAFHQDIIKNKVIDYQTQARQIPELVMKAFTP